MRTLIVIATGWLVISCGGSDQPARSEPGAGEPARASTEEDVAALGREIHDLVDRAMSYRSAHRGQLPTSLRELGIDELTPSTSRSLSVDGNIPTVSVSFRSGLNHTVSTCRGTNALLEEAAISGGEFSLVCTLVAGGSTTVKTRR